MRILITGANGFIGKHLVSRLVLAHEVKAMLLPGEFWTQDHQVQTVAADVTVPESLSDIAGWPDVVIHCAGLTKARFARDYFRVNTGGTRNLLEALAERNSRLQRFILLSSVLAAGPALDCETPVSEDDTPRPIDNYGRSKLEAERLLGEFPFPSTVLRLASVYGSGSADFVIYMKFAAKRIRLVAGFDKTPFSLLHVTDLADYVEKVIESGNDCRPLYYLSDNKPYNFRILSRTIERLFPGIHVPIYIPKPLFYAIGELVDALSKIARKPAILNDERVRMLSKPLLCSAGRFFSDFGITKTIELEGGMLESLGWYREKGWL